MSSQYFNSFGFSYYSLSENDADPFDVVTNIFKRVNFRDGVQRNELVFYQYRIKDSDTPEIIAHKYYDDVNLFWIVTLLNNIVDPILDWPKNYEKFNAYIVDKYGSISYATQNIKHYIQVIRKRDSVTGVDTFEETVIDQATYNSLPTTYDSGVTYTFSNGNTVNVGKTRKTKTFYEWEEELNEDKRNIKILKKEYVSQLIAEMKALITN